jgi:hypothetical protein
LDDQIKPDDFIDQFNNILTNTENLSWKNFIFLTEIKEKFFDQITRISWLQIIIVLIFFSVFFFLNKKFKLQRPSKKFSAIIKNILERFFALLGYFVPIVNIYHLFILPLLPKYPYLNFILPNFMRTVLGIYGQHYRIFFYSYFFCLMFLCLQFKLPKPRFVRFHMVRGLMLIAFQNIPAQILEFVQLFQMSDSLSVYQQMNAVLCFLAINLFWLLPCLYQAVSYTYPKSDFIRDAVEINLGRDNDEGFTWWDRDKKNKRKK